MKKLLSAMLLSLAFTAYAQNEPEEWLMNQRPEHYHDDTSMPMVQRAPRRIGSQATAPIKARGVQHVPVVLVSFADKGFTVADTDEEVRDFYYLFCNGTMDGRFYTGHGSHGSIRDYFVEQSDSVFLPEFTVIGPVTLDNGYAYYGRNAGSSKDTNFSSFRNEAIAKAMDLHDDWEIFDNDGDGSIDMVFFLFAGLGENNGGDADCIWPKESTASANINNRKFATSAATCECRPTARDDNGNVTSTRPDGVGVFIHELSHALGLPDFYDVNYKAFGMDLWSVMDYGEYGNNGYNPGNYTAYERDFMGWRPLQTLDEPCILTIPCFADGGYGYKIRNEANANEYYIIENRQPRGWDDRIGAIGHGLQVTHVDYSATAWNGNRVNVQEDHQRMTIIAANNNYNGTNATTDPAVWRAALKGHLYPGDTYNYELTDDSEPAASVYTGLLMHKPLRNICENEDGTVTVCFRTNGQLAMPLQLELEDVRMDGVDARWESVEYATAYRYELYDADDLVATDTVADNGIRFDNLEAGHHFCLRVQALADSLEDYLPSEWSEKVYFDTLADYVTGVTASRQVVEVYAMNGMCMGRCPANQVKALTRKQGVYVLHYANGATRCLMIRVP